MTIARFSMPPIKRSLGGCGISSFYTDRLRASAMSIHARDEDLDHFPVARLLLSHRRMHHHFISVRRRRAKGVTVRTMLASTVGSGTSDPKTTGDGSAR